jgi:hypothetical protein
MGVKWGLVFRLLTSILPFGLPPPVEQSAFDGADVENLKLA